MREGARLFPENSLPSTSSQPESAITVRHKPNRVPDQFEPEDLQQLRTDDWLVLDALNREEPVSDELLPCTDRLLELKMVAWTGRSRFILSEDYYRFNGREATFHRRSVMSTQSIEERLSHLEHEVARLKLKSKGIQPKENWIQAIIGTAEDDPDYAEIARLGKEIRDAEQPPED